MKNPFSIGSITKIYKKTSIWGKVLIFTMLIVLVVIIFKNNKKGIEGFELTNEFNIKVGDNVYDDFYSNIYDYLVFKDLTNVYEVGNLLNKTGPASQSIILDVGAGTGDNVADLAKQGYKILGIDKSPSLIKKAKQKYPQYDYQISDSLNAMEFQANSYTHILCLYLTIYEIKNKAAFFSNCMRWLMPGGYLILQLVDRNSLNLNKPVETNPLSILTTKPVDFKYETKFKLNKENDTALFEEKITTKDGKVRKNERTFYIEDKEDIIQIAQEAGFQLYGSGEIKQSQYGFQYTYILTKPN